jgi:hypothetical protein
MVEQWSPKPCVEGSSPSVPAKIKVVSTMGTTFILCCLFFVRKWIFIINN